MDDTGTGLTSTAPPAPPQPTRGQAFVDQAREAGYSWDEINGYMEEKRKAAVAEGYTEAQVDEYLGLKAGGAVDAGLKQITEQDYKGDPPKGFYGPVDSRTGMPKYYTDNPMLLAREGMARSSLGRMFESWFDMPLFYDGTAGVEPRSTFGRIMTGASEAVGDIPAAEVGIVGGLALGGPGGAGAGAFALPTAIKSTYADGLDKGELSGPVDFMERSAKVLWETTKSAITGYAVVTTGGAVSAATKEAGWGMFSRFGARFASDVATLTGVNAMLNWKLPTVEEVTDLAGITLLLHGFNKGTERTAGITAKVRSGLLELWKRDPANRPIKDVAEEAMNDPKKRADLINGLPKEPPAGSSRTSTSDGEFMVPRLRGSFDEAVEWVLKKEGGETTDTGGLTRYGISQKAHPNVEVSNLTERMARDIYHEQYWKGVDADNLSAEARLPVFDAAVNQGVQKAKEMWRESGGDVQTFLSLRADHYATLAKQDKYAPYFNGWMNRLKDQGYQGPMGQQAILARGDGGEPPRKPPEESPKEEPSDFDAIASRIGGFKETAPLWERFKEGADTFYTEWFHRNHPIWKLQDAVHFGDPLPEAGNLKFLVQLADTARINHPRFMIEEGMVDIHGVRTGGESLKDIMSQAEKLGGVEAAEVYARARQAQQDRAQGKETGIDAEVADRYVEANRKLEPWLAKVTAWRDATLDYLQQSGILTAEQVKADKESNPLGIPKYRVMDEEQSRTGPRGYQPSNPIKQARGSERQYRPLFEVLMEDAFRRVRDAQNNQVAKTAAEMAVEAGLAERTGSHAKKYDLTLEEKEKFGVDEDADASIWRRAGIPQRADEVGYFADGKFHTVKFDDPTLTKVLKGLDQIGLSTSKKMLSKVTNVVKHLVTLNPAFGPTVASLDMVQQFVTRPGWNNTIAEVVEGMIHPLVKSEAYKSWRNSPAAASIFEGYARDPYIREQLKGEGDPSFGNTMWNVVKSPYTALKAWSDLWMNAIEVGSYARALRKGESPTVAAAMSAEASFMGGIKVGRRAAELNAVQMFFNSWVALMEQSGKALSGTGATMLTERPYSATQTWMKGFTAITLPALTLWWLNKDEDWWKASSRRIKYGFFPIHVNDTTYALPIGQPMGLIFADVPIRMMQSIVDHDPHAFDDFDASLGGAVLPTGGVFGTGVLTPTIEILANYSFLTGEPIVKTGTERYLPEYRDTPYTTELGKAIGQTINVAPVQVDHLLRGYGGSLGWGAVKTVENVLQSAGYVKPLAPSLKVTDWPLFGSFLVRNPGMSAQPTQDYFDRIETFDATYATIVKHMKANDWEAFKATVDADPVSAVLHAFALRGLSGAELAYNPDIDRYVGYLEQKAAQIPEEKAAAFLELKEGLDQEVALVRLIGQRIPRGNDSTPLEIDDFGAPILSGEEKLTPSDRRQLLDDTYLRIQKKAEAATILMDEMGFK